MDGYRPIGSDIEATGSHRPQCPRWAPDVSWDLPCQNFWGQVLSCQTFVGAPMDGYRPIGSDVEATGSHRPQRPRWAPDVSWGGPPVSKNFGDKFCRVKLL